MWMRLCTSTVTSCARGRAHCVCWFGVAVCILAWCVALPVPGAIALNVIVPVSAYVRAGAAAVTGQNMCVLARLLLLSRLADLLLVSVPQNTRPIAIVLARCMVGCACASTHCYTALFRSDDCICVCSIQFGLCTVPTCPGFVLRLERAAPVY
jgi:hypothetical protein